MSLELPATDFNEISISQEYFVQVETIVPHLSSINYFQFDATNTGSDAVKAISKFCWKTLTSLRMRGCNSVTSESCGWMAGAIGHNTPRLRKLKALDVSATQTDDRGLAFLSQGLSQLEYLSLEYCVRLTDRGVESVVTNASFSQMKVLNMRGCTNIGDASVVQMAKAMPKLKHLNLGNCGYITNKSACAIGGLFELETLSVEGAGVNDEGLGMISSNTTLNLLNVTGSKISRQSLLEVIKALGYVQEATHFFGFLIRSSDAKVYALRDRQRETLYRRRNHAAHSLQGMLKSKRNTIHDVRKLQEMKIHKAATTIQTHALNSMYRKRHKTCE